MTRITIHIQYEANESYIASMSSPHWEKVEDLGVVGISLDEAIGYCVRQLWLMDQLRGVEIDLDLPEN